ncbi:hypothetical protein [Streptomyces sp. NPDC047028]|uniref:hypothetical protein n=1 Tax=Streptomyces sp. NPDC047028 TaxID=3155793 RepID=UPI0033F143C7
MAEHQEGKLSKWPRYAPGLWATRKTVAQGVGDQVDGYEIKPDNKRTAWTLQLPGNICATTGEVTADGRAGGDGRVRARQRLTCRGWRSL